MKKTIEIWKPIQGFDGYFISSLGNLKSFLRHTRGRVLSPFINEIGYKMFCLTLDGKLYARTIHRLVLETFTGLKPKGLQTGHLNGIRTDNRLENLKWVTPLENSSHKKLHGTFQYGETASQSKLTEKQVIKIKRMRRDGFKLLQIKEAIGATVNASQISRICLGKRWTHVVLKSESPAKAG